MLPEKLYPIDMIKKDIFKVENTTPIFEIKGLVLTTKLYSEVYSEPFPEDAPDSELEKRIMDFINSHRVDKGAIEPNHEYAIYANIDPESPALVLVSAGDSEEEFMLKIDEVMSGTSVATIALVWFDEVWMVYIRIKN